MNISKRYILILPVLAALGALEGCATARPGTDKTVLVSPDSLTLTTDMEGHADVEVVFQLPGHYLSKRGRLVITPQWMRGQEATCEYVPIVLDSPIYTKKMERREKLDKYTDPYAGIRERIDQIASPIKRPYRQSVELPNGVDEAHLVAVVSSDGCGECTGIDTIDMAVVRRPKPVVIEPTIELVWMEPEFVIRPKVIAGKGVAHLQFVINKSEIEYSLGNNREELEGMTRTLAPLLGDTLATVTSFTITGMASADGSLAFNTALARDRANAAKEWLVERFHIGETIRGLIRVDSRPEGWEPVLAAMTSAGNPDSTAVRKILDTYADAGDDAQERHIRRLPCWNTIRKNYLQKDRKVEYAYSYTLRSFTTDEELLDMYRKRPDAFNEEELLRVAALAGSPAEKREVYQTILRYFPHSRVARNNLAFLYVREGKEHEARELLGVSEKLIIKE